MKKRILFVDDEQLVLDGLQRMLRPMRTDWEMVFVESGARALELMAKTSFDVVISDMRMPGMNGAELLGEVLKRSPRTIRLILSGHADQELVLKCVGSTHQYLTKPCQPDQLKAAIQHASGLEESLHDQELRQLIARMDRLPSLPTLYVEVVEKLKDPDVDLEAIGQIMAQDMAMTAKILKLVNSAFFGLGRQISSAAEAVTYLGLDTIKSLVLSIHAFSEFANTGPGGFSIDALWAHSQSTASLAREIAGLEEAGNQVMDEAFVAGLLHDTGKLVLASNFPDQYQRVLASSQGNVNDLLAAELATFGANHAEVAGYLLGLWSLPVPVVEAVAFHHHPRKCPHRQFSSLTAVHAANALVNGQARPDRAESLDACDLDYLRELALDGRLEPWRAAAEASSQGLPLKI